MNDAIITVSEYLTDKIGIPLKSVVDSRIDSVNEIRLRINKPVILYTSVDWYFLSSFGMLTKEYKNAVITENEDIENIIFSACNNSIYAHNEEFKRGFLTLKGGHRMGFCGTYNYNEFGISGQKDISSINIRIAREIIGCSDEIFNLIKNKSVNVLLCGPPQSGKTTILRDLIRQISKYSCDTYKKVVVIDERGEISALYNNQPQNDIGLHTDIIGFCSKNDGFVNAIRSLSPDIIVCDELGTKEDINSLFLCSTCGVNVIATIHCRDLEDLKSKSIFLKSPMFFDFYIILNGIGEQSGISKIIKKEDLKC